MSHMSLLSVPYVLAVCPICPYGGLSHPGSHSQVMAQRGQALFEAPRSGHGHRGELSALTDLVRSGEIRAFGTSMMPASNLVEAHWVAERRGLERFHTEQPPYSILNRSIERGALPVAQKYGMESGTNWGR